jgi:hypothetical protein
MSSGMPITHRPKIETGSQPTDPFEVIPRIYLSYIASDTSSKASDSTIATTPVARLPKNSSAQRIRHSKPESWSMSRALVANPRGTFLNEGVHLIRPLATNAASVVSK